MVGLFLAFGSEEITKSEISKNMTEVLFGAPKSRPREHHGNLEWGLVNECPKGIN